MKISFLRMMQQRMVPVAPTLWGGALGLSIIISYFGFVGSLSAYSIPMAAQANEGDAIRGKEIYGRACIKCHAFDHESEGPTLRGVFGSKAGTISKFNYSDALKDSKVVWDEKALNKWLADPDGFIADTDMKSHLESAAERTDVIAYLKTLK